MNYIKVQKLRVCDDCKMHAECYELEDGYLCPFCFRKEMDRCPGHVVDTVYYRGKASIFEDDGHFIHLRTKEDYEQVLKNIREAYVKDIDALCSWIEELEEK